MNFIQANNLTLHYHLSGSQDKATLVFLNSLGSDYRIWHRVTPAFAESYQLLCYDKRGHGLSDAPQAPYSLRQHSEDLIALLDQLGLESVILIGVSVGGMIALDLAASRPERVKAMVLSNSGMILGTEAFWNARIQGIREDGFEAHADAILSRWFGTLLPDIERQGYRNMLSRTPVEGYTGTCAAIRDADLRETAKAIQIPTLVITGSEDQSTPPELGRALAETLPDASFRLIEGAGHFPCLEQPQATIQAIQVFLQKLAL